MSLAGIGAELDLGGFAGAFFQSPDDLGGAGLGALGQQRPEPSPQQQELNTEDWPDAFGGKHNHKPFVWVPPAFYKNPYSKCKKCEHDHPLCAKRQGGPWFNMYHNEGDFNISIKAQSYCVSCFAAERDRCRLPAGAYHEQEKVPHKSLQKLHKKPQWMQYYLQNNTNRQDQETPPKTDKKKKGSLPPPPSPQVEVDAALTGDGQQVPMPVHGQEVHVPPTVLPPVPPAMRTSEPSTSQPRKRGSQRLGRYSMDRAHTMMDEPRSKQDGKRVKVSKQPTSQQTSMPMQMPPRQMPMHETQMPMSAQFPQYSIPMQEPVPPAQEMMSGITWNPASQWQDFSGHELNALGHTSGNDEEADFEEADFDVMANAHHNIYDDSLDEFF